MDTALCNAALQTQPLDLKVQRLLMIDRVLAAKRVLAFKTD